MTDIQRAMLGDHDAAARLTEQGVLIPCPRCKGEATFAIGWGRYSDWNIRAKCKYCGYQTAQVLYENSDRKDEAVRLATRCWNTRAPLLTPEQIDMLERMESNEEI
jgi:hypothetical protein